MLRIIFNNAATSPESASTTSTTLAETTNTSNNENPINLDDNIINVGCIDQPDEDDSNSTSVSKDKSNRRKQIKPNR
ncbi:hypothetical protein GJ496_005615 [Pomphorhynchus laevis]|nr:hypothetical protein GJ496_005615 [Pomphorhynchus laevis]